MAHEIRASRAARRGQRRIRAGAVLRLGEVSVRGRSGVFASRLPGMAGAGFVASHLVKLSDVRYFNTHMVQHDPPPAVVLVARTVTDVTQTLGVTSESLRSPADRKSRSAATANNKAAPRIW